MSNFGQISETQNLRKYPKTRIYTTRLAAIFRLWEAASGDIGVAPTA